MPYLIKMEILLSEYVTKKGATDIGRELVEDLENDNEDIDEVTYEVTEVN